MLEASAKAVIEKTRPALEEALRETGMLLGFGHVVGWPVVHLSLIFKDAESPRNLEILVFPMHPTACSFPVFLFLMGLLLLLCHDSMHRSCHSFFEPVCA